MKIAICFFGLPRLIEKCHPDIYSYFIENNDVDIYAHFWWDDSYKGKMNRLHIKEYYDQDENPIDTFKNHYNVKNLIYEECPDFETHNCLLEGWGNAKIEDSINDWNKIMGSYAAYTYYSRHLSIKRGFDIISKPDQYDAILFLRTDLTLFKFGKLTQEIKDLDLNNSIYMPSTLFGGPVFAGEHPNRLGDWFYIGKYINLIKFINVSLQTIIDKNIRIHLHNQERHLLFAKIANIKIEQFASSVTVRRFTIEEWEDPIYRINNMINQDFYINIFKENADIRNQHKFLPFYTKNIITFIYP